MQIFTNLQTKHAISKPGLTITCRIVVLNVLMQRRKTVNKSHQSTYECTWLPKYDEPTFMAINLFM